MITARVVSGRSRGSTSNGASAGAAYVFRPVQAVGGTAELQRPGSARVTGRYGRPADRSYWPTAELGHGTCYDAAKAEASVEPRRGLRGRSC